MPRPYSLGYGSRPILAELVELLIDAAAEAAERARNPPVRRAVRRGTHLTLRPGPDTPLWNQLVRHVRPYIRRHGSQAQLARLLALPRQRLHEALKSDTAALDAERTLLLLGWLGFFQRGGQLVPSVRPGRPAGRGQQRLHPGNL